MSESDTYSIQFDGVARHHTEIRVLIHSHTNPEPVDISQDVIACNTHKGVKSEGKANITLTGSTNYLSLIYPNDYVNVYFNTGDGNGWTRNFFGQVDRIQEAYKVSDSGAPTTTYVIACSDFQKAISKTTIYTNPYILGRRDTVSQSLGTPNIGGVVLMGNGVRGYGSPADLVLNFLYVFMGFASQFLLPESYSPRFMERYRQARREYLLRNVAPRIREAIEADGSFEAFLRNVEDEAERQTREEFQREVAGGAGIPTVAEVEARFRGRVQATLENRLGGLEGLGQVTSAYRTNAQDAPPTLLDVIDTTTFVERESIDGYSFSETLWTEMGSLWHILVSNSNEMVNEMFFDLRPITSHPEPTNTTDYLRAPDEIGGNSDGSGNYGVQFLPALVMREYPFSTINSIDASNAPTGLDNQTFGVLQFGAIFSHEPNRPGRHVIEVPNINLTDLERGVPQTLATKHLDVVVVDQQDLIESDLGRSDHDHFNLLEALSTDVMGTQSQFVMNAELPILTPIHIMRHGLRVRRLDTKFARFSPRLFHSQQGVSEAVQDSQPSTPEEVDTTIRSNPEPRDIPRNNENWRILEALAAAYEPYGCQGVNEFVLANTMHSEFAADVNAVATSGASAITEHTKAIGWCAKNIAQTGYTAGGGRRGSGRLANYRNGTNSTTNIAEAIMPNFVPGRNRGDSNTAYDAQGRQIRNRPQVTARFPGFILRTDSLGSAVYDPERMVPLIRSGGIEDHLRSYFRSNPNQEALVRAYFETARGILNGTVPDPAATKGVGGSITFYHSNESNLEDDSGWGSTPERRQERSQSFNRRFSSYYKLEPQGSSPRYSHIFGQRDINNNTLVEDTSSPSDQSGEVDRAHSAPGSVDSVMTRKMLLRWALLHDHWFQHNLEYLSGSVTMRGNPMIRPGYRLDIRDRNLSFYVEAVGQQFHYPSRLTTTLELSRGQPNNPYPLYVLPNNDGFQPTPTQRMVGSRLELFFPVQDTASTTRSLTFRNNEHVPYARPEEVNFVDSLDHAYDERLIPASFESTTTQSTLSAEEERQFMDAILGLDETEIQTILDRDIGSIEGVVPDSGRSAVALAEESETVRGA